jgi:hypothetical protein
VRLRERKRAREGWQEKVAVNERKVRKERKVRNN